MLAEKFISFLKSNLIDMVDKLEDLEKKAKKGELGFDDLLLQLFANPLQRKIYEQLFEENETQKAKRQDYEAYEQKSPFDKFDYYYQKYEQKMNQKQQDFEKTYENFKQQQQNKQQTNFNFKPSNKEQAYYEVLEVKPTASFEEIKDAYKKAMKKYHPDKFHGQPEKQKDAEKLSKEINEAYSYFEKKFGK